jgi:hypothetical protein
VWSYPYRKLALNFPDGLQQRPDFFTCRQYDYSEDQLYREHRTSILNGIRSKELFDCKRGITGLFVRDDEDPAKVVTHFVNPDTVAFRHYLAVCYAVMHEYPYEPD